MKTLIVYDSQFGNTENVARTIAAAIDGEVTIRRPDDLQSVDAADFDLLVVGSPTHGGRPTEGVQKFLLQLPPRSLEGRNAAAFDTRISAEGQNFAMRLLIRTVGNAAGRIARQLKARGAVLPVDPEGFIVEGKEGPLREGELERARTWAARLAQRARQQVESRMGSVS